MSSFAEFRIAKKRTVAFLETAVILSNFEDRLLEVVEMAPPETLLLKSLRGDELLTSQIGSIIVDPAKQALTLTVGGAIEVWFPESLILASIDLCSGYVLIW